MVVQCRLGFDQFTDQFALSRNQSLLPCLHQAKFVDRLLACLDCGVVTVYIQKHDVALAVAWNQVRADDGAAGEFHEIEGLLLLETGTDKKRRGIAHIRSRGHCSESAPAPVAPIADNSIFFVEQ